MNRKKTTAPSEAERRIILAIRAALAANVASDTVTAASVVRAAADQARTVADKASDVAEQTSRTTVLVARQAAELVAETAAEAARVLSRELTAHTVKDEERFAELSVINKEIAVDVKSLLNTRMFTYGIWKTLTVIGAVAAAIASLVAFVVPAIGRWISP